MSLSIFLIVILALVFSFVALEVVTIRRWKGGWRLIAALPGIALAFWILFIIISVLLDKTSHNLWPFEIVMWSAGGLVFLGLLRLIHRFKSGR